MANKKIEISVDVQSEQVNITSDRVLTLTEQLRLLKKEIQKAGPGKEQDLLIGKFNDINDELDKTNLKSREFLGALGTLPGPVGEFAGSMDFAVNSLRNFTSFTFDDIKAQVSGLAADFGKIATNIGKATGITKIYTVLNNALAASFVKVGVGEQAAAAGARAFAAALTATGIGVLIVGLGLAVSALMEYTKGAEDATAAQKALNEQQAKGAKAANDAVIKFYKQEEQLELARARNAGKSEAELQKIRNEYAKLREKQLSKSLKELQKIQGADSASAADALFDEQQATLLQKEEYNATVIQKQKEANQKIRDNNKQHREKLAADNKSADDMLLQLQQENSVLLLTNERDREDKELQNSKKNEENKVKELQISTEKRNMLLSQIQIKFDTKQKDVIATRKIEDDKKKEEDLKSEQDFNRKMVEIKISAMSDETERNIADRKNKLSNDLMDLEMDKEFIKKSESEKAQIRKDLITATENEVNQIRLDKAKENAEALLQLKQFQIEAEYELEQSKIYALEQLANVLDTIAGKNKTLQITALLIQQAAAVAQILSRSAVAKAGATAAAAPLLANPLTAAAGAIALKAALTANQIATVTGLAGVALAVGTGISKITSAGSGGSTGGSETSSGSQDLGRNYEKGGMIGGKRHAQGGTMIEAEAGEAIMTRGAVTMFAPMLSMMNQMGGGTSFGNQLFIRPDAAAVEKPQQDQAPVIMKTYVVSNELTSEQEKLARLKDLSTL